MSTRRFLRQLFVVFRKELSDSVRDRRAILAIVFGVLVGPAVIAFMVNRIAERQRSAEQVAIPIVGAAHAPALVDWLRPQWGVTVVDGPRDPERAVRDGDDRSGAGVPGRLRGALPAVARRPGRCSCPTARASRPRRR